MKKIYQKPELMILLLEGRDAVLQLATSDNIISEENGGWVKENPINSSEAPSYNVWDDDWRE